MQQLQMMIVIVIVIVGRGIVDQSGLLGLICYARAQRSHQNIVKHLSLLAVRLSVLLA